MVSPLNNLFNICHLQILFTSFNVQHSIISFIYVTFPPCNISQSFIIQLTIETGLKCLGSISKKLDLCSSQATKKLFWQMIMPHKPKRQTGKLLL